MYKTYSFSNWWWFIQPKSFVQSRNCFYSTSMKYGKFINYLLSWFLNKMFCKLTLLVTGLLWSKSEKVTLTFACSTLCVMISTCSDKMELIIHSNVFAQIQVYISKWKQLLYWKNFFLVQKKVKRALKIDHTQSKSKSEKEW